MAEEVLLAMSTFPDASVADRIAEQLVTERLAACANILPGVRSIFQWEGKLERTSETMVFFKTTQACFADFQAKLRALHPYAVPEIITLKITDGLPEYLAWATENCAKSPKVPAP